MKVVRRPKTWLACAVLVCAGTLAAREGAPGLVGRWQLNEKESEDPHKKFRPLAPGEDPRDAVQGEERSSGRTRPGQRPGRPPARPPEGAAQPKLEAPPGLTEFLEAPRTLAIAAVETELTLDDGGAAPLRLRLDGIERKEGSLSITARSEGGALVVEKRNEAGARLTTRYSLMAGERKLEVYSRLAGKEGRAVTLRRVYYGTETTP